LIKKFKGAKVCFVFENEVGRGRIVSGFIGLVDG
jgi:hypothetical protein